MKVLHVSDVDLPARRFNGYDLLTDLEPHGIAGSLAVLRKQSDDPRVVPLTVGTGHEWLLTRLRDTERQWSINALLAPWGRLLANTAAFAEADVIHYHLIHNQVVSLYDLAWLTALKPSVWSFHDPWPLTGHCIHPLECQGWLSGCDPCPHLDRLFPLQRDSAGEMWRLKQKVYADLDVDVVVASQWMMNMVRSSPLSGSFTRVHLIPFGVDSRAFGGGDKAESRRRLGIDQGDFVLLFRAQSWDVKGLAYIVDALRMRSPGRPTTLLVVDGRGLVEPLRSSYRVVERGWVDDREEYVDLFTASDVFLMPSVGETFGIMAIEAMAAGRPVVCFEGSALPSVTHAPECGIAVPARDAVALRRQIDHLAEDPSDRDRRGHLGRRIAQDEYSHERYLKSMVKLYQTVLDRARGGSEGAVSDLAARRPEARP